MKKHRLLFLWLSLLLCAVGARADDLTVNEGTATNNRVPIYGLWTDSYTRTQFIIPADDLTEMNDGTIEQMTFYSNSGSIDWGAAEFEVYITEVDYTSFASTELVYWENMDKVKNAGTLSISDNEMVVTLDNPYHYSGGNLLIGFCQTTSGSYKGVSWYGVAQETTTALGGYNSSIAAQSFLPKTTFSFTPSGAGPTCPKPKGMTVTNTTTTTATVEWNAEEGTQYNIHVLSESSEDTYTGVTSPYTLTGLEAATNYRVSVQTVCSDTDQSDWTSPVAFSTAICEEEDQCLMTYALADAYGDGWNNANLRVVDVETGKTFATLMLANGGKDAPVEGAFAVCPGREISFEWTPGSYPGECSFTIYDVNGDDIYSVATGDAPSTAGVLTSYLTDCTPASCVSPKDLAVDEVAAYTATLSWTPGTDDQSAWEIVYSTEADFDPDTATPVAADSNPFDLTGIEAETTYYAYVRAVCSDTDHSKWSNMISFTTIESCVTPTEVTATDITANSATITWEGNADNYEIQYAEAPGKWLQYDNDAPYYTNIGTGSEGTFTWAVMYPADMITINELSKVSIYETSSNTEEITMKLYTGDDLPMTNIFTQRITPIGNGWHEVTLTSPVTIPEGENLWIELTENGTYNIPACQNTESNNQWMLWEGTYYHIGDLGVQDVGWMIRAFLGDASEEPTWTTDNCTGNSYDISGLDPETTYVFQVRAKCDEDSFSKWAETNFTTEKADASPEIEVTDVTATTATVDWTDKGADPSSWDLWYRLIGNMESFENGLPQGWTTIDNDNDGKNWTIVSGGIKSHSGDAVIASYSYDNGTSSALSPDNWLISPEVTLGGSMSFWAIGQDASWAGEHFAVYLSQDGNTDVSKFTQIYPATGEIIATSEYVQHTIDLSAYKGKGYLAIRHFNITNMFCLNIDDIAFTEPGQSTDWVEMNGLTNHPATIEGLDPEMTYEVQVCTHFGNGDVSEWVSDNFTTLSAITLFDKDMDEDPNNVTMLNLKNGFTLDVTISGRTLYKSGNWNSLCLPFDIENIEASPLAGATVKELTAARIEGTMLYLTYVDASSIEAGKSYIIKWDSGDDIVNPTFGGVTLNATADGLHYGYEVIDLNTTEEIYSIGLYKETILDQSASVLYLGNDNKMYYPATSGFHVGAFRTLVTIPDESTVNGTVFEIDGTATGITEVNGLEIIGGKWYSVDGRKLPNQPKQKGVYINNGRKVVVK